MSYRAPKEQKIPTKTILLVDTADSNKRSERENRKQPDVEERCMGARRTIILLWTPHHTINLLVALLQFALGCIVCILVVALAKKEKFINS